MVDGARQPIEVFFSYSRKDKELRDELDTHLALLKRRGVTTWHDCQIVAGSEWEQEINRRIETADIILLLISSDFIASNYCYEKELPDILSRHEAGEAYVIPVLLRPVAGWKQSPFAKLQICPAGGLPVTQWNDRDAAFVNVADSVEEAVNQLLEKRDRRQQEQQRQEQEKLRQAQEQERLRLEAIQRQQEKAEKQKEQARLAEQARVAEQARIREAEQRAENQRQERIRAEQVRQAEAEKVRLATEARQAEKAREAAQHRQTIGAMRSQFINAPVT
jgi:flagellar biosynthesis GTPase FlhF